MVIDEYSVMSLLIEMSISGATSSIGLGTAFSIEVNNQHYIITNWHNVTGRNPDTNEPISSTGLCDPDIMNICFFTNTIGLWALKTINLKDENGNKLWVEHPLGSEVDVVAIPYTPSDDIFIRNLDLKTRELEIEIYPSISVSIIGYPNGLTSFGKFPIWKTGHVASDIDLDYGNKPIFLIDATTRSGMSGSPVVFRGSGSVQFKTGIKLGKRTKFLGVYSGRIDKESEIGRVWKPVVVDEIISNYESNKNINSQNLTLIKYISYITPSPFKAQ